MIIPYRTATSSAFAASEIIPRVDLKCEQMKERYLTSFSWAPCYRHWLARTTAALSDLLSVLGLIRCIATSLCNLAAARERQVPLYF